MYLEHADPAVAFAWECLIEPPNVPAFGLFAERQQRAGKTIRRLYPDYPLWRDFAYEYEQGKLAIDVINGGPLLREWVDNARATPLDMLAIPDEQDWLRERQEYLCY